MPPCEKIRHRRTAPTKLLPKRTACPVTLGHGASNLPANSENRDDARRCCRRGQNGQGFSSRALPRGGDHNDTPTWIRYSQALSMPVPKCRAFTQNHNHTTLRCHDIPVANKSSFQDTFLEPPPLKEYPHHIYVRGASRLKLSTQSSINLLPFASTFYTQPLSLLLFFE
jgi:hypothetical protein